MTVKLVLRSFCLVFLSVLISGAGQAQEIPLCEDEEVFRVASEAVTEAHGQSNFAGLGGENKVISALSFMIAYEPAFEVQSTIENLAGLAKYGTENIRACMTSEWGFGERAVVFIMLSPEEPSEWGLFMHNVALDTPVVTGWLDTPPPE